MEIQVTITSTLFDSLLRTGYICDYTADGFVLHETAGWVPVGDVLEYILSTEEGDRATRREEKEAKERR